jgi:hypothetical protein
VTDGKHAAAIRYMPMAMALNRAPRAGNKSVTRLPVVLPGASVVSVSRQRKRPASGPKAARVPLSQICPVCERGFGGPDARTRQIRILNRQRDLLKALNQPWQAGGPTLARPALSRARIPRHTAAQIDL